MAIEIFLRPEMITAVSVSVGALIGGVVAIVSEFRRPGPHTREQGDETAMAPRRGEPAAMEEFEHLNRSIWIVEKRLSDRLARVEGQIAALAGVASASETSQSRTAAAVGSAPSSGESNQ
jgi:hypothetical protein